eukprot:g6412.t1
MKHFSAFLFLFSSTETRVSATSIAPGDTYESGDGVKFTFVGTFDDGETALEDGQRQTTAFRQYGGAVWSSNKMLDTCYEQCQDPSQYNYVIGSGSAADFGAAPYVFFAVQWTAWCSCTDKLDKAIPPSNPTENKYPSELLWGDYAGGSSIWMKTYEGGCPAPYDEIVRTGGPYVGNPPADPLQGLDAAGCVADCDAKCGCYGIETNGEFCKLLTSPIDENAEQAARPKANFVLCKKPATSIAPGDTCDSGLGVKFTFVGTFDDGKTALEDGQRQTTAFKQYGAAVWNSYKMLDTCSEQCQDPSQYNYVIGSGSAAEFGAAPYVFFAVQWTAWCSCTDKLDKAIPPSNPTENKYPSELLWGDYVGGSSIWMKTYEGGCPAPYAEIVRTGGPYVGNPPAEPLQPLNAADCVADCHTNGDCVGIETNGEFCKLLTSPIDEDAEKAARPKANFVLCKKPAPDYAAQEKKVQKLAKFVADAMAYLVDSAVDGSTKIADADALTEAVADTRAAAIEAISTNL